MPRFIPNVFTKVEFASAEEEQAASTFSDINRMYLMARRGEIAEQALQLKLDTKNVMDYAMQKAYLGGQLDLIQTLLGD
jgi:hypothetical protein